MEPPIVDPTTEAKIQEILLENKLHEQRQGKKSGGRQIMVAIIISLIFYILTWGKFGFSWANQSLIGAVICIIPLAIGNPWKWIFHHSDPDFSISPSSQIVSWLMLIVSLLICFYVSPDSVNKSLESVTGSTSVPTLQQAQQLNGEINTN